MDLIERLINKDYLTERERKEWLGTIKERLEALEKENKKWREIVGCDLCEALGREILLEENEKLKKAIEILKDYIAVSTRRNEKFEYIPCIYSFGLNKDISQQEYELLKEVLGE